MRNLDFDQLVESPEGEFVFPWCVSLMLKFVCEYRPKKRISERQSRED
jgi:hypothetical protein